MTRMSIAQLRNFNSIALLMITLVCLSSAPVGAQQASVGQQRLKTSVTFTAQDAVAFPRQALAWPTSEGVFSAPDSQSVSFLPAVTYGTGQHNPYSVAIADVNGDHVPDLIVANQGNFSEGSVSVLLGNGDGTFQPEVDYDSGGEIAYSVAVADVNGDGKPDLVVGDSCNRGDCSTGGVGVLLGNGDGTFQPVVVYSTGTGAFYGAAVAIGDLNGDGKLDLAVATVSGPCCAAGSVSVLLGKGDGTFQKAVPYPTGGYNGIGSVAIADVNGDGHLDLLVANFCATSCGYPPRPGSVGVLLGNGDGTFRPAVTYLSGGSGTVSVAVGDLNGDGKPDLVAASCGPRACIPGGPGGVVSVFLGKGDGTFRSPKVYGAGTGSFWAVIADVNGDHKPDVIVSNWGTSDGGSNAGAVTVLLGRGDGALLPAVSFPSGGAESPSVAVGDLNGDGEPDIALACVDDEETGIQGVASVLLNSTPIAPHKTTTVVATSGSPSFVGQPVSFTATVTSAGGAIPDGEVVTFFDGKNQLASVPLSGGVAVYTTSSLVAKTHSIRASYAGDPRFKASSGMVKQIVVRYSTTTALSSTPNPSTLGQPVTFTATVASAGPDTPTGKITFKDGTKAIGSVTLSAGVAELTTSKLAVGSHSITADYEGDAASAKSISPVLNQVVNPN